MARKSGDEGQDDWHGQKNQRVLQGGFEDHFLQQPGGGKRTSETKEKAKPDQRGTLAQHQRQHFARSGAQGGADAEFARALLHTVGNQPVEPDAGQQKSERGEETE